MAADLLVMLDRKLLCNVWFGRSSFFKSVSCSLNDFFKKFFKKSIEKSPVLVFKTISMKL